MDRTRTTVTAIAVDEDRYSTINDPNQNGSANLIPGYGVLFTVDENGVPILTNWNTSLPPWYATEIISRFSYRNKNKDFVSKYQAGHTFAIGDQIYLDSDGLFKNLSGNLNKTTLARFVGEISSINVPGSGWLTFKPRATYRNNISPVLPNSNPGDLIYLSPTGGLTSTKPSTYAVPVYLRLNSNTEGLFLNVALNDSNILPVAPTVVMKVSNVTERDAIPSGNLNIGDQVYVSDTGQGEWAFFIVNNKVGSTITWTKLVDQDSSSVDGRTVSQTITYTSPSTTLLTRVSPTNRVSLVTLEVTTPFHTSATLSIGDDALNARLVGNQDIDLSTVGTYSITPSYQYGGTDETNINAYLDAGTSTQGSAKIIVSYI